MRFIELKIEEMKLCEGLSQYIVCEIYQDTKDKQVKKDIAIFTEKSDARKFIRNVMIVKESNCYSQTNLSLKKLNSQFDIMYDVFIDYSRVNNFEHSHKILVSTFESRKLAKNFIQRTILTSNIA